MTPDRWDDLEPREPWLRRADGTKHGPDGPDWLAVGVALICAAISTYLIAHLVSAVFDLSFGAAVLAVIGAACALLLFSVLIGSVIREGTRR